MPKQEKALKNPQPKVINIERLDVSTFDESFSFLKEKFTAEMKRVEDEMNVFTHTLKNIYGTGSSQAAATEEKTASSPTWESLADSPLIHGEGADKFLSLQFDMSAFDPNEIKVEFVGENLIVSAQHQEESAGTTVHRDFRREFLLPREINPDTMVSSISRDGVLTVQVPLMMVLSTGKSEDGMLSKQGSKKNRGKPTERRQSIAEDPRVAPGAPPANLIPPSPMSSASPVTCDRNPPSKISTQILQSQDTSKQSSKIKPQPK